MGSGHSTSNNKNDDGFIDSAYFNIYSPEGLTLASRWRDAQLSITITGNCRTFWTAHLSYCK